MGVFKYCCGQWGGFEEKTVDLLPHMAVYILRFMCFTGKPAPIVTYLAPAPGGSVRLDWDVSHYRDGVGRIMGFVVQWHKSPVHLQWKRLAENSSYTFLEGKTFSIPFLDVQIFRRKRVN